MPTRDLTLPEMLETFASEDQCRELLAELRWPDGVRCVKCDHDGVTYLKKREQYDCNKCRHRFSVRSGTIFHDSHLPLRKWFLATYIMVESKKGISANQLRRMLGVAYKTAWYLCHRIRKAIKEDSPSWLTGTVEVDESFVGGKVRGHKRGDARNWKNKTIVAAAVQRGGKVRLKVVPNRGKRQLKKFIHDTVHDKAEAIYTDVHSGYAQVSDLDTDHKTVTHGRNERVNGKIHTNTVEGVFSLLDRSIVGAYHKVSKKHLPAYLHEVEWRYNNRRNPYLFRDTMIELVNADPMEYAALTAQDGHKKTGP